VLIDWLLFGRAGISTLIKPREDDYEEDDGDYYRPSNPLDLVVPDSVPSGLNAPSPTPPPPVLDPRRPLSARTDIGDPPVQFSPGARQENPQDVYNIALNQLLPPIDQMLPGASPMPLTPFGQGEINVGNTAISPPGAGESVPTLSDEPTEPARKIPGPLILPTAAEIAAAATGDPLPPPAEGVSRSSVDPQLDPLGFGIPTAEPFLSPAPQPVLPADPVAEKTVEPPIFAAPTPSVPVIGSEPARDIFASFPPDLPDAPFSDIPFFQPQPEPSANIVAPPITATAPPAEPAPRPNAREPDRVAPASLQAPGDLAPLSDLLARLESGMQRRRPTAPPPIPLEAFLPTEPARRPLPTYAAAPARMIDPPPAPVVASHPDPVPAFAPVSRAMQETAPLIPHPPSAQPPAGEHESGLLDQPLHVALDVLRNRVRRSG